MLNSPLGRLRVAGLLEGISCLALFGVAMPLKYFAGNREPMFAIGLAHGVLFMLFVACAVAAAVARRWPLSRLAWAGVASVVPGGTFVFDRTLKREQEAGTA